MISLTFENVCLITFVLDSNGNLAGYQILGSHFKDS